MITKYKNSLRIKPLHDDRVDTQYAYSYCDEYDIPADRVMDYDFQTEGEAKDCAQEEYEEMIALDCTKKDNGRHFHDRRILIKYNVNSGRIVALAPFVVSYEHYHGDYDEHHTLHKACL